MVNPGFMIVVTMVLLVYGGLNYYIGLRGWQALFSYVPFFNSKVYWTIFLLLSLAYLFSRLLKKFLPIILHEILTVLGAYWMACMLYFLLIILLLDLLRVFDSRLHFVPVGIKQSLNPVLGLTVFVLVIGIISYGAWNARHPRINHYDLTITKQAGALKKLHVVMVSDIHLGTIIQNDHLTKLVDKVNELKPDLILMAGDVFDEDIESKNKQQVADNFRRLSSTYGSFAVLGNHEYIGGNANEAIKYLNEAGVKVLRDSSEEVGGSFALVGRDDLSGSRFNGTKRESLATLMEGINPSLPIIVMDHQPSHLEEPVEQKVDLQVSGHTHNGQLFPIQFITQKVFEQDWGYLRKGDFQLIVSSGYGTWGPPIRIGNTPEIVDITITFK
ncbi:metallophosphoesterase [Desulfosporosinus meridiei]|uniref:Putative phosphohydrolase n=1 Tax=Desulfosporosinus meridiei (strain ATCC BAA-275 / DSM 13257 / KCTC 12902 / NCIMB 13706 / S10) TaxID=768704 RepID=J7ILP9_DESMD|nr:metallophosphoesterase [Desulfosporosinus meridiei]AFQ42712.1 putative phosphohydrolase [Desulfosporosinus meridiei DSM 13257]